MSSVVLIVIYNHQFLQNVDYVNQIYKDRFSKILHLMPFYTGSDPTVIPVYEKSYYFQGYLAQAFKTIYNEKYDHYIFVADDLILNPIINETNYKHHFGVDDDSSFITDFIELHKTKRYWPRIAEAVRWKLDIVGVEAKDQLPSYEVAIEKFRKMGLEVGPIDDAQCHNPADDKVKPHRNLKGKFSLTKAVRRNKIGKRQHILKYPIVGGYSDILVVDHSAIKIFSHYCGVFAATNLHVELAAPTSLVLAAKRISTEKDITLGGKALWVKEDYQVLDKFGLNLNHLLSDFPEQHLFLHPVKLSQWEKDL